MRDPQLHVEPRADLPAQGLVDPDVPVGTFEPLATAGEARAGRLHTAHGIVHTPCFMPVGTYGAVKGLLPEDLVEVGSQIVLANAYHLAHRPGSELVERWGGLHAMMDWKGPILTDSGGYQVFSLRGLQRIDDEGVDYQTHFDGSKHRMTPRSVLEVQRRLGSDICMILDHCPPGDASALDKLDAMDRTTRWAKVARDLRGEILAPGQLCFGIVQGGTDLDARRRHLDQLVELEFDGYALGGLSVGEPVPAMHATMAATAPHMPADKPRYVMGIGTPADLLAAVRAGVDMFDCVMPSRHARNAQIFTWAGKFNIRRAQFREDEGPLDPNCGCTACQRFTRAYLRHLHAANDPLYVRLATAHNLYFFHQWVGALRQGIVAGRFESVAARLSEVISTNYPMKGAPDEG